MVVAVGTLTNVLDVCPSALLEPMFNAVASVPAVYATEVVVTKSARTSTVLSVPAGTII